MSAASLRTRIVFFLTLLLLLCSLSPVLSQQRPTQEQIDAALKTLSPEQLEELRQRLGPAGATPSPSATTPSPGSTPLVSPGSPGAAPNQQGTTISPEAPRFEGLKVMDGLEKARAERRVTTLESLERFGASFFNRTLEELADTEDLTVPDDYQILAGDQLNVTAYNVNGGDNSVTSTVDEKGELYVPGAGPVGVGGLTKAQVDAKLGALVASKFPNMRVRTAFVKVRKIRVFVLGESVRPGGYLMNPNSTVLDALLHAGGPSESGSFRAITLERRGQTIRTFDLYDLLIRGKTDSPRLLHGDRVFVPLKGVEVSAAGEVQRPAIYELLKEKTLADVIKLAGGLRPEAYSPTLKLERIDSNQQRKLLDLPLAEASRTQVKAGDMIYVNPVLDDLANGVFVEGAVRRPGWYQLSLGMTVADLIKRAEGLADGAYASHAELFRLDSRSEPLRLLGFDLGKAMQGDPTQNLTLHPEDRLVVYSRKEAMVDKERVRIQGEVQTPGEFARFTQMRVRDLIVMAGGVTPEASMSAELARPGPNGRLTLLPVDLNQVLIRPDSPANIPIQDLDVLIVRRELRSKRWPASVTLLGEFKNPGEYAVDPDRETLADVVRRAGGPTELAYPRAAVFTRQLPKILAGERTKLAQDVLADLQEIAKQIALVENLRLSRGAAAGVAGQVNFSPLANAALAPPRRLDSVLSTGRVPIDLEAIVSRGQGDPRVKDGDVLFLPQKPEMVIVSGAITLPSPIVWKAKLEARDYIEQAGGFAEDAAEDRVLVLRVNGSLLKEHQVDEIEPGDLILVPPRALIARPGAFEQLLTVLQVVANGAFFWRVFD